MGRKAGITLSVGTGVVLPKGVDRVPDRTTVGPCQPVGQSLALEAADILLVESLMLL